MHERTALKVLKKPTALLLLALFGISPGCAAMPAKPQLGARGDYAPVREYISLLVKREMRKNDVTGLSLALVDDQRVVWSEGFGWADKEVKVPATADTLYRVGSISKLFTATAAMQLVERGKMDLDGPLTTYLTDFSVKSRFREPGVITPRTLMTHHSGLPSDYLKGMWTRHPAPFTGLVRELKDEYVSTQPGTVFSYSNAGMTLLGCAIEQVSGVPFADELQANVLRPLGMSHSSFIPGLSPPPLGSKAYRDDRETVEPELRDLPAGGLNSSVADLSRFMEMVFDNGRSNARRSSNRRP